MKQLIHQLAGQPTPTSIPKVSINETQMGNIFGGILIIAGIVCVVFIIIGAIQYITSQGDASNIKKAKDSILFALLGLVFTAVAFFIVQLVIGVFK